LIKRLRNTGGYTVIETILTAVILGTALLGGMMVMQNATANTVNNDFNTVATQLANEKVEIIIADKEFLGMNAVSNANYPSETVVDVYNMTRSVSVTEVNASDLSTPEVGTGLKVVVVTVTWGTLDYQKVSVTTLLADYT